MDMASGAATMLAGGRREVGVFELLTKETLSDGERSELRASPYYDR